MKNGRTRKAALAAVIPGIMIPVQQGLQSHHAPDAVIGLFAGTMIGLMILLLISATRDRTCGTAR